MIDIFLLYFNFSYLNEVFKFIILMKLEIKCFYQTALHIAVEKEYPEIVKLLLSREDIDVNAQSIKKKFFLM